MDRSCKLDAKDKRKIRKLTKKTTLKELYKFINELLGDAFKEGLWDN